TRERTTASSSPRASARAPNRAASTHATWAAAAWTQQSATPSSSASPGSTTAVSAVTAPPSRNRALVPWRAGAVGRAAGGRRTGAPTHPESVDDHAGEGGAELSAGQNGVEDRGERAGRHSDEGVFGCGHSGVAAAASGPKKTAEQQNRSSRHR